MITTDYNLIKEYIGNKRLYKDFYIEDVFTYSGDTFVTCVYWSDADGQWDQHTHCIEPEHWNDWLVIRRDKIISNLTN
jgi:hypothetical protein